MSVALDDLTKGSVDGTGAFDVLMRTVADHLDSQYKESKITGSDYANIYLGSLTAVLQQSSQYLLGSEQLNKQLLLLDAQIKNMELQSELVEAQVRKMDADTEVSIKQIGLMDEQIAQAIEQTKLITQQTQEVLKNIELKTAQVTKLGADQSLVEQQTVNAENQNTTITKQQDKLDAENLILAKKLATEEAQTEGDEATVKGLIGKQMILLDKQAEGFDRNAEQKLAKIMIDTWTVRQTTDGAETTSNGLVDSEINNVLNIAKTGIGAPTFNG